MNALETGDRAAFLQRLRQQLAGGIPDNPAHPLPPPLDAVPLVHTDLLDADDVVGSFERNATAVRVAVHRVDGDAVPTDLLAAVVERHGVRRAVVSASADAQAVGALLRQLGVEVLPLSVAAASEVELGVTGAAAAIATTGTLVQDSGEEGGRTASLLPPIHLCVVRASRIVPTSAEVLRPIPRRASLPSNIALITGPSRSGDIEQIITLGVHGPLVVEVAVLEGA